MSTDTPVTQDELGGGGLYCDGVSARGRVLVAVFYAQHWGRPFVLSVKSGDGISIDTKDWLSSHHWSPLWIRAASSGEEML